MTEKELRALVALLQRIPVTLAEGLWIEQLVARLAAEIKAKAKTTDGHLD